MKKSVLILTAVFGISSLASAQGFFIGGSLGFGSNSYKYQNYNSTSGSFDDEKTSTDKGSFSFAPTVGYTLNDDWEISATFKFRTDKDKLDDEYYAPEKDKTFGVALSGRRYFELSDKFNWYVDASLYFSKESDEEFSKSMGKIEGYTNYTKDFGLYIVPGIDYEISDHWSVDMDFNFISLGYGIRKYNSEDVDGNPCYSKGTSKSLDFGGTTETGTILGTADMIKLGFYYTF